MVELELSLMNSEMNLAVMYLFISGPMFIVFQMDYASLDFRKGPHYKFSILNLLSVLGNKEVFSLLLLGPYFL